MYVDSGAFIAVVREKDRQHDRCENFLRAAVGRGARLITSEVVVSEVATRLRYDVGLQAALSFRRVLSGTRRLTIRESDQQLRQSAFEVMERYADLRLSYADCVGAAVAKGAKATAVFSLDDDFRVLGFHVEPS